MDYQDPKRSLLYSILSMCSFYLTLLDFRFQTISPLRLCLHSLTSSSLLLYIFRNTSFWNTEFHLVRRSQSPKFTPKQNDYEYHSLQTLFIILEYLLTVLTLWQLYLWTKISSKIVNFFFAASFKSIYLLENFTFSF